jgi:hypothetical protein
MPLFGRILLDDDAYVVISGVLGGIYVKSKLYPIRRKVSLSERLYLSRIITLMRERGVPIEPGTEKLAELLREFSNAALQPGKDSWQMFFVMTSPERWAEIFS